ncbi:DUF4131 domain-containing protein, partial [Algibacter sp.]|uniref:DUF4131 domain-containing protein n=1 Tax=Algibacter sp. TaxID=1872428 RepID=UPI003C7225E8
MKLLNFAIIKLTICLIIGILIGYLCKISINVSIASTVFLLCNLFVFYLIARKQFIKTIWFGVLTFLVMISIGVLTSVLHNQKNFSNHYSQVISAEADTLKTITFRIREVLKPSNYYDKYVVDILEIDDNKVSGKTLLNIQKDS